MRSVCPIDRIVLDRRTYPGLVPTYEISQQLIRPRMRMKVSRRARRNPAPAQIVRPCVSPRIIDRTDICPFHEIIPRDDLHPLRMAYLDRIHPHLPHAREPAILVIAVGVRSPEL